jgi:beta-N-acetylhexosaminidase
LAYKAGYAIALELAAMGINIDYAPVCDVNINPDNPVVGTRSFGEDSSLVASLSTAMLNGIQAAGIAATAKHFPGHGDTASDSHHGVPVVLHEQERLRQVELLPFAAAVQAGVKLVMTAHIALPAFNQGLSLPSTLSPAILKGLLRGELGYQGVIVTDAMNMNAIQQGPGLVIDALAACAAGVDLLLLDEVEENQKNVFAGLVQAVQRGLLSKEDVLSSAQRILDLKGWLKDQPQPALSVVGCAEHQVLAYEIACRSVTLVRDQAGLLPLDLPPDAHLAIVIPQPGDLTPADTSSYIHPELAQAACRYHPNVDEFVIPINPSVGEIQALYHQLSSYSLVIIGTINARDYPGQAALVNRICESDIPSIVVALRMPYDLQAYPAIKTYACTYSILPPAMEALCAALWGKIPFEGQIPVTIPVQ